MTDTHPEMKTQIYPLNERDEDRDLEQQPQQHPVLMVFSFMWFTFRWFTKVKYLQPSIDLSAEFKQRFTQLPKQLIFQSSMIVGRAIYMAGMAQNGVLRYIDKQDHKTTAADYTYVWFVTAATSLSLLSAIALSAFTIFVQDAATAQLQLVFTYAMRYVWSVSFVAYAAGCIFLGIAIIFMPYGCNYEELYGINVVFGVMSTALMFVAKARAYACYHQVQREITDADIEARKPQEQDVAKRVAQIEAQLSNVGSQATLASAFVWYNVDTLRTDVLDLPFTNFSSQWDVQALFLLLNVITVLAGLSSTVIDQILHCFAVSLPSVHHRYLFYRKLRGLNITAELLFCVALGMWFAVFACLGVTKINPATYVPGGYACVGAAFTLMGYIYLQSNLFWANTEAHADNSEGGEAGQEVGQGEGGQGERGRQGGGGGGGEGAALLGEQSGLQIDHDRLDRYLKRPGLLTQMAFSVLFLGGFAYNTIVFYEEQALPEDPPYVHFMSASFIFSVIIISWSAFYNICAANCHNDQVRYLFALNTSWFYYVANVFGAIVVVALIAGFSLIGYIKSKSFYRQNMYLMAPVMSTASAACFLLCTGACAQIYGFYRSLLRGDPGLPTADVVVELPVPLPLPATAGQRQDIEATAKTGSVGEEENTAATAAANMQAVYQSELAQISASTFSCSFVAGNVCYEILFSQSLAPNQAGNYNYFVADNWTFASAVAVVTISTFIQYFVADNWTFASAVAVVTISTFIQFLFGQLEGDLHKVIFCKLVRSYKHLLFLLAATSLFTWLWSVMFMPYVKYTGAHTNAVVRAGVPLMGLLGVLAFLHMAFVLKRASNRLVEKEKAELRRGTGATVGKTATVPVAVPASPVPAGNDGPDSTKKSPGLVGEAVEMRHWSFQRQGGEENATANSTTASPSSSNPLHKQS
eukprot:CAMPEP_0175022742 /NCGR_PEP_ID=MMETSP0005-20121125/15481_1 /TAXON_ID=420556 /ORGANISM="Ochromonas sp., Strain CCMP1393" /LENGTH=923 /DNA_ID=CAMNT_0016281019 /DNA_START=351 /DNA_END=3122 /DNA_ORIENTATION=+